MNEKTCATCDKCSITLNATMLSEKPAPDTYLCEATGIVTNPFAYCIDYRARRDDDTGEPDSRTGEPMTEKTCDTCDNYDGWTCKIDGFIMGGSADACEYYRVKRNADTGERCSGTGEPNCGPSPLSAHCHELAARLRLMHRFAPFIPCHALLHQAIREILPEGVNYCEEFADLIDRPTCTIVDSYQLVTPGLEELELDDMCVFDLSCGHEVHDYEKPEYCPKCGATVVDE